MKNLVRTSTLVFAFLAVVATVAAAPAAARSGEAMSSGPAAGPWCATVIRINTKYGTMKDKRYLPQSLVPFKVWVAVIDVAVKSRSQLLAITPNAIKQAQSDELAYFARVKANHYLRTTTLAPLTLAEIKQLNAFQRTQCGIKGI